MPGCRQTRLNVRHKPGPSVRRAESVLVVAQVGFRDNEYPMNKGGKGVHKASGTTILGRWDSRTTSPPFSVCLEMRNTTREHSERVPSRIGWVQGLIAQEVESEYIQAVIVRYLYY